MALLKTGQTANVIKGITALNILIERGSENETGNYSSAFRI
jgi:hypothetical protein